MRWRLDLSCYSFDNVYHPGKENVLLDTLSRATCAATMEDSLFKLYQSLCHQESQGSTTLFAQRTCLTLWMMKRVTNKCPVFLEFKPQYHKPNRVPVIKATQPFEPINIDFKGPLPSNNGNKYFLTIVDKYSRFPFIFLCSDVSTAPVIKCLTTQNSPC